MKLASHKVFSYRLPEPLNSDFDIILSCMEWCLGCLTIDTTKILRNNKQTMLKILERNGAAIVYTAEHLKHDSDILAVRSNWVY